MATAYRVEIRRHKMSSEREQEVTSDDVHTSLVADLQEEQDREVEMIMNQLQDKVRGKTWTLPVGVSAAEDKRCWLVGCLLVGLLAFSFCLFVFACWFPCLPVCLVACLFSA